MTAVSPSSSYSLGGSIHVSGMGMPSFIIAQYDVCFSMDWIDHGLFRTYTSSISEIFFTHSRLVLNQCVSRSITRSYLGV